MYHMFLRISMSMKLMVNIKEPIIFQQQMFVIIFRRVFRKIAKSTSRCVKCALCQSNVPMNFRSPGHLYNIMNVLIHFLIDQPFSSPNIKCTAHQKARRIRQLNKVSNNNNLFHSSSFLKNLSYNYQLVGEISD